MNLENVKSCQRGSIGLGAAIAWFTANRYTVSVPLNDSQQYDLVVEKDGRLFSVQVKFTSHKAYGTKKPLPDSPKHFHFSFFSATRPCIGRPMFRRTPYDKSRLDFLFVFTSVETKYLIPVAEMRASTHIKLSRRYDKYIVH